MYDVALILSGPGPNPSPSPKFGLGSLDYKSKIMDLSILTFSSKVPQGINEVSYRVTINERPKVKAYSFKKMSVSN